MHARSTNTNFYIYSIEYILKIHAIGYAWLHVHARSIDRHEFERNLGERVAFFSDADRHKLTQHHHSAAKYIPKSFPTRPGMPFASREQGRLQLCVRRTCMFEASRELHPPLDAAVQLDRTNIRAATAAGDARKPWQYSKRGLQKRRGELRFVATAMVMGKWQPICCTLRLTAVQLYDRLSRPWPVLLFDTPFTLISQLLSGKVQSSLNLATLSLSACPALSSLVFGSKRPCKTTQQI